MYDDFEFYENIVSPIPDGDHANENESKSDVRCRKSAWQLMKLNEACTKVNKFRL